ncbi:MAG: tetratricopeptide (TPR) repeat protein [Planctomycetota bacterium]|jgi:tetratricopeptide (TPR) repeat protein
MTRMSLKHSPRLWALLIVLITVGVHWPVIDGEIVYQDAQIVPHVVLDGVQLSEAVENATRVISDPAQLSETVAWEVVPTYLRALSPLFGGDQARTLHALSALIHVLSVLALLRLAQTLGASLFSARAAALLFALHPLTVQSNAWIGGMGASLASGFALFAIDAFERARAQNRISLLGGISLFLALLSSPLAFAVLPVALYLYLSSVNDDGQRARPRTLLPIVLAFAVAWGLGTVAFGSFGTGFLVRAETSSLAGLELIQSQLATFASAITLCVWPSEQTLFRPISSDSTQALVGLLFVALFIVGALIARRRKAKNIARAFNVTLLAFAPLAIAAPWMLVHPVSDEHLKLMLALCLALFGTLIGLLPNLVRWASVAVVATLFAMTTISWIPTWNSNTVLLKRAAETAPELPFAQWNYAYALIEDFGRRGDPSSLDVATEVIERAQNLLDAAKLEGSTIEATPVDFLRTNLALGWCLLSQVELEGYKDYDTPHRVFTSIIEARPDSVEAHVGLGLSALGKQALDEAEQAFRDALVLDANSLEALRELAGLMITTERWKAAQEQYEHLLQLEPRDHLSRIWLARALLQQGAIEPAQEQALIAHEQVPLFPDPMVLLGITYLKLGRPAKALEWIDLALRSDPENGFARLQRGHAFEALGEAQNAMVEFKRAADRMPDSFEAFYSLGNSLLLMRQPDVAAEQLARAYQLEGNPDARRLLRTAFARSFQNSAPTHFKFAGIDFRRDDRQGTRFWVDMALAAAPNHVGALHLSGILNRLAGRFDVALADFGRALDLLPDSFQVNHDLGYLLIELDRPFEAVAHLRRAMDLVPEIAEAPEGPAKLRAKLETTLAEIRGN